MPLKIANHLLWVAVLSVAAGAPTAAGREDAAPREEDSLASLGIRIGHDALLLRGDDPALDHEDLEPLRAWIGDARIVGLGEQTHGTRELRRLHHRLLRFLVEEMGFTVLALESDLINGWDLDAWIHGGEGDPGLLLRGLLKTEEVVDMLRWMRRHIEVGGALGIDGIDLDDGRARQRVLGLLHPEDPLSRQAERIYGRLDATLPSQNWSRAGARVPDGLAAGKLVRLQGWIRTQGIEDGWAGLYVMAHGEEDLPLVYQAMADDGPRGTTDWRRYSLEVEVPGQAREVSYGLVHAGTGAAWFDDVRVEIDGEAWEDPDLDLDFETAGRAIGGLWKEGPSFRWSTTRARAHLGSGSLVSLSLWEPHAPKLGWALVNRTWWIETKLRERQGLEVDAERKRELGRAAAAARAVRQSLEVRIDRYLRDQAMAENVRRLIERQPPGTRIVILAHNGHVGRIPERMGWYLDRMYGDGYLPIATATGGGTYAGNSQNGTIEEDRLVPPPEGSIEAFLQGAGAERIALDLREVEGSTPLGSLLGSPVKFRHIGYFTTRDQFLECVLPDRFDLLFYLDRTRPTGNFRLEERFRTGL